ncbi:MAG TPA: helix-turn-helix transcriptional regulator [Gaiellaceae bacterium]|nr:helix-turn-helix transcriptional regulator [Gaiellaceae bacterium]
MRIVRRCTGRDSRRRPGRRPARRPDRSGPPPEPPSRLLGRGHEQDLAARDAVVLRCAVEPDAPVAVRERRGASVAVRVGTDIARRGARHRRVGVVQAAVDEVARGSVDADGVVAVAAAQVVDAGGAEVRDRVVRAVPVDRVLAVPPRGCRPRRSRRCRYECGSPHSARRSPRRRWRGCSRASGSRRQVDAVSSRALTPRERQIALLVADGATNREAASSLFVSTRTIEFHLGNVYRRLGVRSRTELVRALSSALP